MAFEPVKFFMTPGNLNKPVAVFLFGGWLALAIVAAIYKEDLGISFQGLLVLLVVLSLVVGALAILPRLANLLLGWLLVLLFAAWLTVVVVQVATSSLYAPPLATVNCLLGPLGSECNSALSINAKTSAIAPLPPVMAPPARTPDLSKAKVFVQFAGFVREDVVAISTALANDGWNVQGANQGGERLSAAAGLHEVRFFHSEDAGLANALASAVSAKMAGSREIVVKDLSNLSIAAKVPPGQFEIWISK